MALICVISRPLVEYGRGGQHLPASDKGIPIRFLWYHAAEIAGFALIPPSSGTTISMTRHAATWIPGGISGSVP